ncbi:hypothetical protein SLEP1_g41816 [Rubroshorea leprosula]|uniref:Uncharacterized protein n=1 Tax=Rubroshorea leprosula TaxID=152421 RepID=A0AAV5L8D3_9ROSI|nr:hypothetical protein SLEP1_g41816 [Rubroshorea leprosula]
MIYAYAYAFATIDANKKLRSTDLVALEYADLNLKNFLGMFLQSSSSFLLIAVTVSYPM